MWTTVEEYGKNKGTTLTIASVTFVGGSNLEEEMEAQFSKYDVAALVNEKRKVELVEMTYIIFRPI